ncbi:hypothetical protein HL666_27620 [Bradyrhizobium sp. 83002]|uniref:YrhB domain-containing protein n=1 Tax=Bradyrhizobium aeschynomenes TaxID=2734909 RepID=UPI0015544EE6|nr:YrhB domain-containing protein [Bradyrhizobium aeschynomenes]NPU14547.1 hypothetical protein [Bradyrhizobium aeschynomenes]
MKISSDQAQRLAEEAIKALANECNDVFALMNDRTIELENGWVFFYNTKDFVETRDARLALAGNGPIYVSRRGDVCQLPSAVPWEQAIKDCGDGAIKSLKA